MITLSGCKRRIDITIRLLYSFTMMHKILPLLAAVLIGFTSFCQEKIPPTNHFKVKGKVSNALTFSDSSIKAYKVQALGEITTVNSKGEAKSIRKEVKGILLKTILEKAQIDEAKSHEFVSYYFVLLGSDGYKSVLSYSEVFYGGTVYLVTESEGKDWKEMEDRIEILILLPGGKGRNVMKGLTEIKVEKAL
jgi:hypothetical protein